MSRARNIATLLDSSGDVIVDALGNVPPSNDASALTTGTLDVARLGTTSQSLCPTGVIFPYVNATAPAGWDTCDGRAISRTTYSALFAVIGTTYGAGDGSTTFNLPNFTDRVPVGKSGTKSIGGMGGAATATPTINNTTLSTTQIPGHTHTVTTAGFAGDLGFLFKVGSQSDGGWYGSDDVPEGGHNNGTPGGTTSATYARSTGGGGAHNHSANAISIEQPWVSCHYIIKL